MNPLQAVLAELKAVILKMRASLLAKRNGLIHCPVCDSTRLCQRPGMASFQTPFECENGHRFSVPTEGP